MALTYTAPADVTSRWVGDDPIPADDATITILLGDAEDEILRAFPDVDDRIAADPPTLTVERVKKVAARMVMRVLRNPKGLRTATETTGPFSENETFAGARPGEIYLSTQDRADLADGTTRKRAYTIDASPNLVPPIDPLTEWGPAYSWGIE